MVERQRLDEGFRRQPGPAPEQVMQVGFGYADGGGDLGDFRLRAPMRRDEFDGAAHDGIIGRPGPPRGTHAGGGVNGAGIK